MKFKQEVFPLIEASELKSLYSSPNLVVFDISPSKNISSLQPQYPGLQIVGAWQVDLKNHFSRKDTELPNMAPSPTVFAEQLRLLGIDQNTDVVIYDNLGIYTSPRLWWLFRVMGHERVRVLNGGLDAWLEAGGEVEEVGPMAPVCKFERIQTHDENLDVVGKVGTIQTNYNKSNTIWSLLDIQRNLQDARATVVDARSAGRFKGTAPEPRAGWPSGHIPDSVNVPWNTLINKGRYLPAEVLKNKLSAAIPATGPLVFSCGSGLTACIVLLAAAIVWPERSLHLYDGSWVEWANPDAQGCPIATG